MPGTFSPVQVPLSRQSDGKRRLSERLTFNQGMIISPTEKCDRLRGYPTNYGDLREGPTTAERGLYLLIPMRQVLKLICPGFFLYSWLFIK